ncbi:uncharacterized protein PgNI_02075 [Pyricularia grisea]|uniref:PD-(D/E)XK nuclease-like domain-containing protein n=1 Tax=Pyricularia grisea TaxID=148305 RepID=A0A6P8BJR2_PYRGI|nr:uncharacterized protein PgNI_02075 [Pyricularia grisea]TLD17028.1 hypothetical protein PgNI_02075 [Pyricularia grisea]
MTATQATAICTCKSCLIVLGWLDTIDDAVVGVQPTPPLLPQCLDRDPSDRLPFAFHPPAPPWAISSTARASTSTTISRNKSQSQRSTSPVYQWIYHAAHSWPGARRVKRHTNSSGTHAYIYYHVVNQVGIAPVFVPPVRVLCPDQVLDAKIDLAPSLTPWRDSQFKKDILSAVIAQPLAERTVLQTMHDGLLFQPIAVAIKTKVFQGDENCGLVQLGVWTAAWHVGMRKFMPPGHGKRLVTLPVLLVAHYNWSLFFCVRPRR